MFELTLTRKYFKDEYTIGALMAEDEYICDTIEDKVRPLNDLNGDGDFNDPGEGKVYGQTAIPEGRYKVQLVYWAKHQKTVPILLNVPGYTGILIHSGTTAADSAGCIIVGENKEPGKLLYSRYQATRVTNIIRAAIAKGESVYITIKS